jgi:protein tyrosine phosphatase (PTP) superfamily phosphohydrolase (DUF442 family)
MTRRCVLSAILAALALAASGCRAAGARVLANEYGPPPASPAALGSMRNVSVSGAVWIGSHPSASDLDLAHRRGIATVIDLSLPEEGQGYDVAATCEGLGIAYVPLGIQSACPIPEEAVDRALSELRSAQRGPVLMFCGNGGRAAMVFAIWRALDGGIGVEEALVEARRSGMKPGAPEDFVRAQIVRLSGRA